MIGVGSEREIKKGIIENIELVEENEEELKLEENSLDEYKIELGIRNVKNIEKEMREDYRVIKKGGSLMWIEF